MKMRHRVPNRPPRPEPISERYQAEVDHATAKLERAYMRAQKRLEVAERRAHRVEVRAKPKPKDIEVAWAEVELRRQELAEIQKLMQPAGAPAKNRGRESYRPVPISHGIDL